MHCIGLLNGNGFVKCSKESL